MTIAVEKITTDHRQSHDAWWLLEHPEATISTSQTRQQIEEIQRIPGSFGWCQCVIKPSAKKQAKAVCVDAQYPFIVRAEGGRASGLIIGCAGTVTAIFPWHLVRGGSYFDTGFFLVSTDPEQKKSNGLAKLVQIDTTGNGFAEFPVSEFRAMPISNVDPFTLRGEYNDFASARSNIADLSGGLNTWECDIKANMAEIERLEKTIERETRVIQEGPGTIAKLEETLRRFKQQARSGGHNAQKLSELSAKIRSAEDAVQFRREASERAEAHIKELEAELKKVRKPVPMPEILKNFGASPATQNGGK